MGDVLEDLSHELSTLDVTLDPRARPLRFGTWIGGDRDGNPNVTPEVTLEVLVLQHGHAIRDVTALIDALLDDLSPSARLVGASDALLASIDADIAALPELDPRVPAHQRRGAYRLKARSHPGRLANTGPARAGAPTRPRPRLSRHGRAHRRPRADAGVAGPNAASSPRPDAWTD